MPFDKADERSLPCFGPSQRLCQNIEFDFGSEFRKWVSFLSSFLSLWQRRYLAKWPKTWDFMFPFLPSSQATIAILCKNHSSGAAATFPRPMLVVKVCQKWLFNSEPITNNDWPQSFLLISYQQKQCIHRYVFKRNTE